jgi:hypothetical protein
VDIDVAVDMLVEEATALEGEEAATTNQHQTQTAVAAENAKKGRSPTPMHGQATQPRWGDSCFR